MKFIYYRSEVKPLEDQIANLQAENAHLEAEQNQIQPYVETARELQKEYEAVMDAGVPDEAEQAFQNVLSKRLDEARGAVVARYEAEHKETLFERLLREVDEKEGEKIRAEARTKVDTDPELDSQLRAKARKILGEQAMAAVSEEISAEQAVVVAEEAKRQIALDRLDVKLSREQELDLADPEILGLLQPGDKVDIFFDTGNKKRGSLTLRWCEDANGNKGWIYDESNQLLFDENSQQLKIKKDRFVSIATVNKDLVNGKSVPQEHRLVLGLPFVLLQGNGTGTKQYRPHTLQRDQYGNYRGIVQPLVTAGTDFQTKDLVFTSASANKNS